MLGDYKSILVPVDGSDQAEHSFKQAVAIAKRNNAKLLIVHVADNRNVTIAPEYTPLRGRDFQTDYDTGFMDEYLTYAKQEGVEAEMQIMSGNPMNLIAETIPEEHGCDLIVIGATGKGAVTRALVGSVSNYVVKNAKRDVLIVRG